MIKYFFIATILSALTLTSCCSSKCLSKKESVDLNNQWEMVEYLGKAIDTNVFNQKIPTFKLNPSEGSFAGNNGCNSVNGKMSTDGSTIKMDIMMGTKMYCDGVPEHELETKISEVNNYQIKGDKLFLKKDKETLFVFQLAKTE